MYYGAVVRNTGTNAVPVVLLCSMCNDAPVGQILERGMGGQ
jgi:hypothetical protein